MHCRLLVCFPKMLINIYNNKMFSSILHADIKVASIAEYIEKKILSGCKYEAMIPDSQK